MYVIHTCIHDISIKKTPTFVFFYISKQNDRFAQKYFSRHSLAKSDVTHVKKIMYLDSLVIKRDVQEVSQTSHVTHVIRSTLPLTTAL